jgi:hypothetical protein
VSALPASASLFLPTFGIKAWQITGCGVRQVLIRKVSGTRAYVSRLARNSLASDAAFGFVVATSACLITDLFETEGRARAEHRRRREATFSPYDRRVRLLPAEPMPEPTL